MNRLPYLACAGGVFVVDRLSKRAVGRALDEGAATTVIPGFFDLVHWHNRGVAFGLFSESDSGAKVVFLSLVAMLAIGGVLVYSFRNPPEHRLLQVGLALILGGALGNLVDRIAMGYVVDFLYFYLGPYSWPAFNAADSAITVGVGALALLVIQDEVRNRA